MTGKAGMDPTALKTKEGRSVPLDYGKKKMLSVQSHFFITGLEFKILQFYSLSGPLQGCATLYKSHHLIPLCSTFIYCVWNLLYSF